MPKNGVLGLLSFNAKIEANESNLDWIWTQQQGH